ncbi:MAG: Aminoacyl-histidine dipeptidase (Peptidase D) (EC [uncultured Sulfurovum sp.]|uniref:Aminoacyl-histidine dipeptidase (Peptidase D) (EC) n=1 Tax=uncultured Sulfurovum sp. TaxID=269237 RepID=A0A6S6TI89_9BACT|nr:MAG: Aminoacyl-histidine dipeptidase (Peptidase D) (EC [uncultured Sulfurovum sp.]
MNIIDNFLSLTKLPHCSENTDALFTFILDYAQSMGYETKTDSAKNILIRKGKPTLALQAHYDMVCMGKAPKIETYIEEGWMSAKESSLGADNGIAIAMMMVLMERGEELEFVLTAEEEVGLVGAGKLAFDLSSKYMLNIDYEDEGIVCIGCAGGSNILGSKKLDMAEEYEYFYEVSVRGLDGGHSGVDIDKNIPNAIKVLVEYLATKEVKIASFTGGERRNSIPANVVVKLSSTTALESKGLVEVKALNERLSVYESDNFLKLLLEFKHGIHEYNDEFNLADSSINLAIVSLEDAVVTVQTSARAMNAEGQKRIDSYALNLLKKYDYKPTIEDKYASWKPEVNTFTSSVNEAMVKVFGASKYEAIHAGLECGVIGERYPDMKFASIGPNIEFPHSTREKVELASVEKTFEVVEEIINKFRVSVKTLHQYYR